MLLTIWAHSAIYRLHKRSHATSIKFDQQPSSFVTYADTCIQYKQRGNNSTMRNARIQSHTDVHCMHTHTRTQRDMHKRVPIIVVYVSKVVPHTKHSADTIAIVYTTTIYIYMYPMRRIKPYLCVRCACVFVREHT